MVTDAFHNQFAVLQIALFTGLFIVLLLILCIQLSAKKEGCFFAVSISTVCIQFNHDKLEMEVVKVVAETHTGSQLHSCERNPDTVHCILF